jgi:RimJ/RimL family protein N-acetyltransferase
MQNLLQGHKSGRVEMISSSAEHIRIELETPELLAGKLNAFVSEHWPSGEYDRDAMAFFLSCFETGGDAAQGWYGWYAVNIDAAQGARALVGAGGYFGPPNADGIVEIGYSVLPEWQRRGYATEMVNMLVAHASSFDNISKIIAHTSAENIASVNVLTSCGFKTVGAFEAKSEDKSEGNLRFEYLNRNLG